MENTAIKATPSKYQILIIEIFIYLAVQHFFCGELGMIMEIAMVMKLVMITAIVGADLPVDQILTRQMSSHPAYFAS